MPRVPTYGPRRVSTAPLPGARVNPAVPEGAFGVPAAVDLSGVQRLAADVYQRETEKADEIALLDADNQLAELSRSLETEARARRGKDALGAGTAVREGWTKGQSEIAGRLSNERQRMAFARRAQMREQSLFEQVERHAAAEGERYAQETTEAALALRVDEAVSRYDDPRAREHAIAEARIIVGMEAERMGLSPEARTLAEEKVVTRAHVGVIERMLSAGDDRTASAYYAEHGAEIAGERRGQIEKALEEGSTLGEAQRQADQIIATAPTRAAAMEQARAIEDPKVRQATTRELEVLFAARDRAEADDYRVRLERAADKVERGGTLTTAERAGLKAQDRRTLDSWRKAKAAGESIETDWEVYYNLKRMASDPARRQSFAETSLLTYRTSLADTEFKELVNAQAALRQGKASPELDGYRTTLQIVDDGLAGIGVNPNAKKRNVEVFRRAADQEIAAWKRAHGKDEIPTEEVQRIVGGLLVRGPSSWLGIVGGTRRFDALANTDPDEVNEVSDIPAAEQEQIRSALQRQGVAPTDDVILDLYRERLRTLQAGLR